MDLLIVPTIGFDLLYALVIIRLQRRDLVWINVTTHPTAEWIARLGCEGLNGQGIQDNGGLSAPVSFQARDRVQCASGSGRS